MSRLTQGATRPQDPMIRYIKLAIAAVVVVMLLVVTSCNVQRIQPDVGYEAVLVKKPRFFGSGGVDKTPIKTGSTYVVSTTEAIMVNMQPQLFSFTADDMMTDGGIPLHLDPKIRLEVIDSVGLIEGFGAEWYQKNVETEFQAAVRQAVRKHGMNELAIQTTGLEAVDKEVSQYMTSYLKSIRLPVHMIKVTVGKATPPPEIKEQRIRTAAQVQRQETEKATKIAEDNREAAERSRATADNAYRQTLNLNPAEFVDLQRIQMQEKVCNQEKAHCTFIIGGDGRPVLGGR